MEQFAQNEEYEKSEKLHHIPCEECGSKDNAAVYSDGHTYCFGCTATKLAEDAAISTAPTLKRPTALIDGYYSALPVRGITEETCRKFDYQITNRKFYVILQNLRFICRY